MCPLNTPIQCRSVDCSGLQALWLVSSSASSLQSPIRELLDTIRESSCLSVAHPMAAKCTQHVQFRLHMHANVIWLNCTTQDDKPCADGIHVHSKMNAMGTFGMGRGDATASLICLLGLQQ